MTLGQNICRLRTERGLSQGDLADALDVSRQSISKWETDASIPELEKLLRLSELFHISLDALVGGEAAPEPPKPRAPLPETLFLAPLDPQQARRLRKAGVILFGAGLILPWLARWLPLPALILSLPALLGGLYLLLLSLPELPGDPPIPQSAANTQRLVGGILIGCGMLALLWLRTRTASLCFSLWLPFLLCGVLLLTLRRRAWLPCLWVCGWMALARWQHIPWHWLRSDLQDCSLGEDFPLLLILCGALLLAALSLFACRKAVLPWSGRRLAGVWGGFLAAAVLRFGLDRLVLSQINTSAWPDGVYRQDCYDLLLGFWQLTDVLLWLALTAALIATAALLRGRKAGKIAS